MSTGRYWPAMNPPRSAKQNTPRPALRLPAMNAGALPASRAFLAKPERVGTGRDPRYHPTWPCAVGVMQHAGAAAACRRQTAHSARPTQRALVPYCGPLCTARPLDSVHTPLLSREGPGQVYWVASRPVGMARAGLATRPFGWRLGDDFRTLILTGLPPSPARSREAQRLLVPVIAFAEA